MSPLVPISLRALVGLLSAFVLAFLGVVISFTLTPGGSAIPLYLLVVAPGFSAGLGGFLGWLKPEAAGKHLFLHTILGLGGGQAGAWLGLLYGRVLYPKGVENVLTSFNTPPIIGAVVGAAIGANLLTSLFYVFRLVHHREI